MRLSVTDLDTYRSFLADEDASLEDLLLQLRRKAPPTIYMKRGRAFHKILERAEAGKGLEISQASFEDFSFRFELDASVNLPEIRELKGEHVIQTSVGPVTLVGKVDGIGAAVHDAKLTSYLDMEKYLNSYQWRCYLVMFNAWKFIYDLFVCNEDTKTGEWVIRDYHELALYRYTNIERDVRLAVDEFARFVHQHLPEKIETIATTAK